MNLWELTAPCHFGTEAVLKREILDLGYEVTRVEDGRVTFEADAQGVADANLFLRTTERVLLKIGEVKAETFDELFEKTKALPWENYIPKTVNSGYPRQTPSKVSFLVHLISSPL